jgi:protein-L-isoaspartate(D-aspartate) O-methyltransferase
MRLVLVLLMLYASIAAADETNFTQRRQQLVDEVRTYARYAGDTPFSDAVMESLNAVERHRFVPAREVASAYENRPLPIGHGQTISQPYIVALMTDLLEPEPGDVVLEVGTGSGYQAAVLSGLVATVYVTRLGDGYYGWGEHAPFDGIIVTAAASHVPPPLIEQLKPGGRMVIPVGARFATQYLLLLEKNDDGEVMSRQIAAVRFVPLTGKH